MRNYLFPIILLCFPAAAQETPTFRAETRLVEVQVVVTGRGGVPAAGLIEDDFTILENGKRRKIAFFSPPQAPGAAPAEPLPAGLLSNRPEYAPAAPRAVTAVLLDLLNTPQREQYFARSQLARFLRELRPTDLVGIYVLSGAGVRVVHDFSSDPRSLTRLAERVRNEWPVGGADLEQQMRAEAALLDREVGMPAMGEGTRDDASVLERRVQFTMRLIEMLSQHLGGVPGRKSLAWITGGTPEAIVEMSPADGPSGPLFYRHSMREFYRRAANVMSDSNVAIYPIDAGGLRPVGVMPPHHPPMGRGASAASQVQSNLQLAMAAGRDTFETMKYLAESTGGRPLYESNDLAGGLRRAADDAASNYTLAYYTDLKDDARKRDLEVKVNRRGFDVLARRRVPLAEREAVAEVRDLLESPVSAAGILLNGRVTRRGGELRVKLQIEPGNLLLTRSGDRTVGTVEIYLAQIEATGGRTVADTRLALRLTEAELENVARDGLMFERAIALHPAAERLRVVVRDARTGAAGTLDAVLREIPEE